MPYSSILGRQNPPAWLEGIAQRGAERAEAVSNRPFQPYRGHRIAPMGNDIYHAHQMARQIGQYEPYFQEAAHGFRESQRSYPERHHLYHNAHEDQVVRQLSHDMRESFGKQTLPDIAFHFARHGHHGSSRHRDIALRAQHEMEKALGSQIHQARAHGFESGHMMHSYDLERRLRAANSIAELGGRRQAARLADIAALESAGDAERSAQQAMMDVDYGEYLREHAAPGEGLATLIAALQGVPYSSSVYSMRHDTPTSEPRINTMGKLGALATQLLGANISKGGR